MWSGGWRGVKRPRKICMLQVTVPSLGGVWWLTGGRGGRTAQSSRSVRSSPGARWRTTGGSSARRGQETSSISFISTCWLAGLEQIEFLFTDPLFMGRVEMILNITIRIRIVFFLFLIKLCKSCLGDYITNITLYYCRQTSKWVTQYWRYC